MLKLLCTTLLLHYIGGSAMGQTVACGEHKVIAAELFRQWGEVQRVQAITGNGDLMEVYASPDASWTILLTFPKGVTCIMATGQDFELLPPPQIGSGRAEMN